MLRGQKLCCRNHFHSPPQSLAGGQTLGKAGFPEVLKTPKRWRLLSAGGQKEESKGNENAKFCRMLGVESGREAGELLPDLLGMAWLVGVRAVGR